MLLIYHRTYHQNDFITHLNKRKPAIKICRQGYRWMITRYHHTNHVKLKIKIQSPTMIDESDSWFGGTFQFWHQFWHRSWHLKDADFLQASICNPKVSFSLSFPFSSPCCSWMSFEIRFYWCDLPSCYDEIDPICMQWWRFSWQVLQITTKKRKQRKILMVVTLSSWSFLQFVLIFLYL